MEHSMSMQRFLTTLCIAAFVSSEVSAQPAAPWPFLELHRIYRTEKPEAPLTGVLFLVENEAMAREEETWHGMLLDLQATAAAIAGDHLLALRAEAEYFTHAEPRPGGTFDLSGYRPRSAAEAILEASRGRRVVMLNEEHRVSIQRAFLAELIEGFHREGFTHLALETLSEDPAAVEARGYITTQTGFYTRDPALAEAVRRALQLGMKLHKYEPASDEIGPAPGDRDRRSGENLAKLVQGNPSVRVVVYAGRYHIAEIGDADWKPMAAVFKDRTGIDPLTVEMSSQRECHLPEHEHPAYREARSRGLLMGTATVLMSEQGEPFTHMPGQVDMAVFFPPTCLVDHRPQWLSMGGWRRQIVIADRIGEIAEPLLARADRVGEPADAVPADQVIIWPERPVPALLAPPGKYRVRILRANGEVAAEFQHILP
jgi:hypothetical protein